MARMTSTSFHRLLDGNILFEMAYVSYFTTWFADLASALSGAL